LSAKEDPCTRKLTISPHLFLYDATVLVLPFLCIAAWVERGAGARAELADQFRTIVAGL